MADGNYDAEWLRKAWPRLLLRWAVFAALVATVAMVAGGGIANSALLGVFLGGLANIAWQWVA